MAKLRESSEEMEFQAEVNRMMKLIINSLYKNKVNFSSKKKERNFGQNFKLNLGHFPP